tara:strand:- start:67 stop:333 length:267 start_codon:yes stop_codon:yes gene_type:complete
MSKRVVSYDFDIEELVCIKAEVGTDPEDIEDAARRKLAGLAMDGHISMRLREVFDDDTGTYYCGEDWECVPEEVNDGQEKDRRLQQEA